MNKSSVVNKYRIVQTDDVAEFDKSNMNELHMDQDNSDENFDRNDDFDNSGNKKMPKKQIISTNT